MNYGLPYQGSKNRIAKRLVDALPPAPVLYDVFCGGCAVTHAAMLSGKYRHFVVNDLRGWLPDAFQKAIHGGYAHEDRWISREDFERLKSTDAYAAMCFSFGNDCRSYMYARGLEPYKRALHYAIFWKDTAPWRELCPETADALKKAVESEQDRHKRRIGAGRAIVTALKAGLMNGTIDPAVMNKPIYKKIRPHNKLISPHLESCERFERMKNLETLQTDESLCRLQSLERSERITDVDVSPVLTVTTGDYRALNFERGGIIYCDPPYKNTKQYHTVGTFDFEAFYSWCEHQANPVFISEYTMPEDRFVPVAAFTITRKMNTKKSSICHEKIWRPRIQL